MVFEKALSKNLMYKVVGAVLIHLDFFENDPLLASNIFFFEQRIQNQVAQDIDGHGQVLIHDFHVETCAFLRRKCVLFPPISRPVGRYPPRCGWHFLNSMCSMKCEMPFEIFIARTRFHPYADRPALFICSLMTVSHWATPRAICVESLEPWSFAVVGFHLLLHTLKDCIGMLTPIVSII
jgi:hypothetical protein